MRARSDARLWMAIILIVAFAVRMWQLGAIPFGFHPDEGHNALDALRIVGGWRPVFLPANNGREPLFIYLQALSIALLGPTIWAMRYAAVVVALVVISSQYVMTRCLPIPRPNRTALYGAALIAITFWPIAQARYGLRANLLPAFVALMLWAWWRALALPRDPGHPHRTSAERMTVRQRTQPNLRGASASVPTPPPVALPEQAVTGRVPHWVTFSALSGFFLAAAIYTHLTGRLLPAILVVSALWTALRFRRKQPLAAMAIALAVAATLALPMVLYFTSNPEMVGYRADQVSAFNPDVNKGDLTGLLVKNGVNLARMFFVEGDRSWYHNIAGQPMFGLFVGLAFVIGLLLLLRDLFKRNNPAAQSSAVLLGTAFVVTLVPSWLSIGAPNYVRLTGIWPVAFLLAARGLVWIALFIDRRLGVAAPPGASADQLAESNTIPLIGDAAVDILDLEADLRTITFGRRHVFGPRVFTKAGPRSLRVSWWLSRHPGRVLVAVMLFIGLLINLNDYFTFYARAPQVYDAFNGSAVERGQLLAHVAAEGPMYITPALAKQSVIQFLTTADPPTAIDPRAGLVLPPIGDVRIAFDPVEADDAKVFGQRWPMFMPETLNDSRNAPSLLVYRLARAAWPTPPTQVGTTFGQNIELEALAVDPTVKPGGTVNLTLQWLAREPTATDQHLFVHLVDDDGHTVAQFDGPPLDGSYGTNQWRPGERILQPIAIPLPDNTPAGPLVAQLGWYDYRTQERLAIAGDDDSAADVATITVAP